MLSTPLGFGLGLSLHYSTPLNMRLEFILVLVSAEAHSFLLVDLGISGSTVDLSLIHI